MRDSTIIRTLEKYVSDKHFKLINTLHQFDQLNLNHNKKYILVSNLNKIRKLHNKIEVTNSLDEFYTLIDEQCNYMEKLLNMLESED